MLSTRTVPAICCIILTALSLGGPLGAETASYGNGSLFRTRGAIVAVTRIQPDAPERVQAASLFMDRSENSLFALPPQRSRTRPSLGSPSGPAGPGSQIRFGLTGSHAELIRHIIGWAESNQLGYDAVQYGARIRPSKRPTALSISEIFDWIEATPGQHHAIGRYQFIPSTLKRLIGELGIHPRARFTPDLQDQLADRLLVEAGFESFLAGAMTRHQFMNNLAKIWAGLPTNSGKSYYHGFAGNRATMTWAQFDAEMARIFPG